MVGFPPMPAGRSNPDWRTGSIIRTPALRQSRRSPPPHRNLGFRGRGVMNLADAANGRKEGGMDEIEVNPQQFH